MLYSLEIEQQVLAAFLQHPNHYFKYNAIISSNDFDSTKNNVNGKIYYVIKQILENGGKIDRSLVLDRINSLDVSFANKTNKADYIDSLYLRQISEESIDSLVQELKKYTVKREICNAARTTHSKVKNISNDASYQDIISICDESFNSVINSFELGEDRIENLYDGMIDMIEELGKNPIEEDGFMGPFPTLNKIYGSLLLPGNITVIVSRSGVGKTSLALEYCSYTANKYNVPVIHFDNGEMSKKELQFRRFSALSGVPIYLIRTGRWSSSGEEIVNRVRKTYKVIQEQEKFYYFNVAGKSADEICNTLKHTYYSKVGRGKNAFFSFDYIKLPEGRSDHWIAVGQLVNRIKQTIQKDIVDGSEPLISCFTSVQANRSGIVTNKHSKDVQEDEGIIGLSDMIQQYCSHMFLLRKKTLDEIAKKEGKEFGTHKLINLKPRHLGQDVEGALVPIKMPDGSLQQNFINLDFSNFDIQEKGDLRDIVRKIEEENEPASSGNNDLPDF